MEGLRGLLPPPHWDRQGSWSGTYGGLLLCDQTMTEGDITLESVDYSPSVPAEQIRVFLRHVPPADERTGAQVLWTPDNGLLGTVRSLQEDTLYGDFDDQIDGASIDLPCDPVDRDDPFLELIFEVHASRSGADIPGFTIHYREGGEARQLQVDWEMIACGTDIREGVC